MAAARLVLHIGDFKTGTTGLQHWLATGPGTGPGTGPATGAATGPAGIAALPGAPHAALAQGLGDAPGTAARMAAIGAALAGSDAPWLVVSAEHFEFADPARLRAAVEAHLPGHLAGIRILGWVRPHIPGLLARYAESVKIGSFTGSPQGYLRHTGTLWRMGYAARFGRWRAVWGDSFGLRLYDRDRFPGGDIRREFALALTGRDPGPLPPAADPNPTPGVRGLALARALYAETGSYPPGSVAEAARWSFGRQLGRRLAEHGADDAEDPPLVADRAFATALAGRFAADAAALDAGFFADGALAAALIRDRDAAPRTAPDPDPEALLSDQTRAVLALWGRMLADGLSTPERAAALNRVYHEEGGPFPRRG